MRYLEFEKKYRTGETKKYSCRLMSAGGVENMVDLDRRVMRIPLGDLITEYHTLLANKPKRFVLGIIPNLSYQYEMIDWTALEKLLKGLLSEIGTVEWHD